MNSNLKIFLLYLGINILVHIFFINLPPSGVHVWRQCNTLAVARNFAEEDMNLLETRVDKRENTDGITGSPFPLYEWGLAGLYKVFGERDFLHRIYSIMIFTLGMFAFFLFNLNLNLKTDRKIAIGSGLLLLSVPQLYYDSLNAMPDILALSLSLFSAYFFSQYSRGFNLGHVIPAILMGGVAGMIKFQFLIIPFACLILFTGSFKHFIRFTIAGLLCCLPVFIWYQYALKMMQLNHLPEFGLWIKPITLSEKLETIKWNLISDIPEMLIGWPLLLYIFYQLLKNKQRLDFKSKWIFIAGILAFIVFYFIAIERMGKHSYYFIALVPFLVFLAVQLSKALHLKLLNAAIVFNLIWAFIRIVPGRWSDGGRQISSDFKRIEFRDSFRKAIPAEAISLTGPDISGCIYFYFTHTKGYSLTSTEEFRDDYIKKGRLDSLKRKGLRYLVLENTDVMLEDTSKLKDWKLDSEIGNFKILRYVESEQVRKD